MNKMNLLINVHARFMHALDGSSIHGKQYTARLYDKDIISDDFLGEVSPDKEGRVHFTIDPASWKTKDSILESHPDFYIILMHDGTSVFKTPVAINIDFDETGNFNATEGEWIDLGTFMV